MLNWPAGLSVALVKSFIFTSCSINQVSKQQMSLKFIRERLVGRMTSSSKYQKKRRKHLPTYLTCDKCAWYGFCNSWLILRSSEAECLTTSSTVTGRLCFHVSVRDSRLHRARVVPVCPGNVLVFIFCLRKAFLFLLPVTPKKKHK